ncbi:hypothetical protein LPC10_05555 [Methylorubrum sp. B1-46]|jgi:hypothetical protein|uniref:hypothetical protein n=1 Tax=Methylorubrum sp. B1-46 TaxID=2897334 RepID=UPI001E40DC49|nr:hypothetical protein [Methylorubrum sp. B1-46]UGB27057.1 hypothetical protein LPC10_05555 [Methylorubrum sp. B1-46]
MTDDPVKTEPRAFLLDPWTLVPPPNRRNGVVFSPYFPERNERPEPSREDDAKLRRRKPLPTRKS